MSMFLDFEKNNTRSTFLRQLFFRSVVLQMSILSRVMNVFMLRLPMRVYDYFS